MHNLKVNLELKLEFLDLVESGSQNMNSTNLVKFGRFASLYNELNLIN